jgi:hypothetical protein
MANVIDRRGDPNIATVLRPAMGGTGIVSSLPIKATASFAARALLSALIVLARFSRCAVGGALGVRLPGRLRWI